ncbi:MAG TPA: c-type cytochrome [Terriglobales bacterium]|nr:c-type cytochrome [Terriglobales bacterium]
MGPKGLLTLLLGMSVAVASAGARQAARRSEPAPPSSPQLQQGREVFVQFCAACHGERGDGKPPTGLKLKPPAMDLTAFRLSEALIRRALEEGVLGTGMAAWKSLPAEQLSAVAVYTASLGGDDGLSPQARLASDGALQEAGRRVYVVHCTRCHGNDGKGDGSDASLLKPVPPSFAELRPSYAEAARVIAGGVPGSAMPAWPLLTRAEVQAVTFYIRSFYRAPERASSPAPRAISRAGLARP